MKRVILVFGMMLLAGRVLAEPWRFESASAEVQRYIVHSLTSCVQKVHVTLMQDHPYLLSTDDPSVSWRRMFESGLDAIYCIETLKGDASLRSRRVCYLYPTPRNVPGLQEITSIISEMEAKHRTFIEGRDVTEGDARWELYPPYNPYNAYYFKEFIMLMFLTPERVLDRRRFRHSIPGDPDSVDAVLKGVDRGKTSPQVLMERLGVTHVFSNRVFRLNEGCAFQVDYPVAPVKWRSVSETEEEHEKRIRLRQKECTSIMHLSGEEASEITYLAYAVDGRLKEYDEACRRCPKILKPVPELRTKLGRMFRNALVAGGMLAADVLPEKAESSERGK